MALEETQKLEQMEEIVYQILFHSPIVEPTIVNTLTELSYKIAQAIREMQYDNEF